MQQCREVSFRLIGEMVAEIRLSVVCCLLFLKVALFIMNSMNKLAGILSLEVYADKINFSHNEPLTTNHMRGIVKIRVQKARL